MRNTTLGLYAPLITGLRALSSNPKTATAVEIINEWDFTGTSEGEMHCVCGCRIFERCHILNKKTTNAAIIGNECIKHVLEKDYYIAVVGFHNLTRGKCKNFTAAALQAFRNLDYITAEEHAFMVSIRLVRNLELKEQVRKTQISLKIYGRMLPHDYQDNHGRIAELQKKLAAAEQAKAQQSAWRGYHVYQESKLEQQYHDQQYYEQLYYEAQEVKERRRVLTKHLFQQCQSRGMLVDMAVKYRKEERANYGSEAKIRAQL